MKIRVSWGPLKFPNEVPLQETKISYYEFQN